MRFHQGFGSIMEIFGLLVAALALGAVLSRFNALALVMGSILFSGGTIVLSLMLGSLLLRSVLSGVATAFALQAGYVAGVVLGRRSRK